MKPSRFGVAFAILLVSVVSLRASEAAPSGQRWLRVTSSNFELFTTEKEKGASEAIRHFETVRSFFLQITGSTSGTPLPVRIIGFRSDKEFEPYRPKDFAEAYYLGGPDRDYIVMRSITTEAFPAAVHEYMHLLTKHSDLTLPLWLNEGLAELFSTLTPIGDKVRVGAYFPGRIEALRKASWIDLETLMAIGQDSPYYNERERAGVFYSQSWILTHLLYFSDEYRSKFGELLDGFSDGSDRGAILQRIYGKTPAAVQKDLARYAFGGGLKSARIRVKLERSAEKPQVRPATALESGLALASLLALVDKTAAAKERYAALARQHPDNVEVQEALGYIALRNDSQQEARRHFSRAAEIGSSNAKMYFDYAGLLHRTGEADAVEPLLRKALALNPGFAEARYRLGFELYRRHQYKEALDELGHFVRVTPEQACEFFHVLALTLDGLDLHDRAVVAAKRAREHARSASEVETTERLIQFVNREKRVEAQLVPVPADASTAPPRLAQPLPPEAPARDGEAKRTVFVLGVLRQVDCLDKMARIRLDVDGKEMAFLISDPHRVLIEGSDEYAIDFNCGPQPPKRILVEFEPRDDETLGTAGIVVSIEFKELRRRP